MKLDDFNTSYKPMKEFFEKIKTKPMPFKHLFDDIKYGILTKHPAIIEFLELANKKNWLNESKYIIKSAHITFILEHLTAAMCNNTGFCIHIHIQKKEKECGLDSKYLFKTFYNLNTILGDFFSTIKTLSVDPMMIFIQPKFKEFKLNKQELKKLRKNKEINFFEYKILSQKQGINSLIELGRINIYEAGISEYKNGFKDNSIAAQELSEDLNINFPYPTFKKTTIYPENTTSDFYKNLFYKKNKFINIPITQKWMSLYETWNLAFILGDINNLDLIIPKLIIPSVINSNPENFIAIRVIALWLSINNFIFRDYETKNELIGPKNKIEMAKAWGKINKKYALELAKTQTHENNKTFIKNYDKMFSKPIYNFTKMLINFLK